MISEPSKRRENFDEFNSVPVILADGQPWHVPKPWLQVRASFEHGKAVVAYPVFTCGPKLDELIDAMAGLEDARTVLTCAASLGAMMLLHQYDLADEDLDQLFAYRSADPESWDWAKAVMEIAIGHSGPKRSSGGGRSR